MIYNIAVSAEGTSEIKHATKDDTTGGTTENATSGKTKISKKQKVIHSKEKYASIYM